MLWKFGVVSACCFLIGSAWAGPSFKPSDTTVIQVEQLDPDADMSAFDAPGYEVHRSGLAPRDAPAIPTPERRDQVFAVSGVRADDIRDWDAVDRDVLYLRAKALPLDQLQARYPAITPDALRKLKQSVDKDNP